MERQANTAIETTTHQFLVLEAAGQRYAVELLAVCEIRRWQGAVRVPHADPSVCGVVNVRGAVVPVIDLLKRLGYSPIERSGRGTAVAVLLQARLGGAERTVGLLVDSVSDVMEITDESLREPPAGHGHESFVAKLFTDSNETVVLLSVDALLTGVLPLEAGERGGA